MPFSWGMQWKTLLLRVNLHFYELNDLIDLAEQRFNCKKQPHKYGARNEHLWIMLYVSQKSLFFYFLDFLFFNFLKTVFGHIDAQRRIKIT